MGGGSGGKGARSIYRGARVVDSWACRTGFCHKLACHEGKEEQRDAASHAEIHAAARTCGSHSPLL